MTAPEVVTLSILFLPAVNQRFPSGPAAMFSGLPPDTEYSLIVPEVVIFPILPSFLGKP